MELEAEKAVDCSELNVIGDWTTRMLEEMKTVWEIFLRFGVKSP